MKHCRHCNKVVQDSAAVCPFCRRNLGEAASTQPRSGSTKKCPFCAEAIQLEAIVCKHCGRDLPAVSDTGPMPVLPPPVAQKKSGGAVLGCATLLLLLALLANGWLSRPRPSQTAPGRTPSPRPRGTPTAEQQESLRKTMVARGLAESAKVVSDATLCDTPKAIADAWTGLKWVKREDAEWWAPATGLVSKLEACRQKTERNLSKGMQSLMVTQRETWAKQAERIMLDQGMDVEFKLSGRNKDRLTMKWVLMGKVAVHKITNGGSMGEGAFLSQMQKIGFRRVDFVDGHDFNYYYDLEPTDEAAGGKTVLSSLGLGSPLALR